MNRCCKRDSSRCRVDILTSSVTSRKEYKLNYNYVLQNSRENTCKFSPTFLSSTTSPLRKDASLVAINLYSILLPVYYCSVAQLFCFALWLIHIRLLHSWLILIIALWLNHIFALWLSICIVLLCMLIIVK